MLHRFFFIFFLVSLNGLAVDSDEENEESICCRLNNFYEQHPELIKAGISLSLLSVGYMMEGPQLLLKINRHAHDDGKLHELIGKTSLKANAGVLITIAAGTCLLKTTLEYCHSLLLRSTDIDGIDDDENHH